MLRLCPLPIIISMFSANTHMRPDKEKQLLQPPLPKFIYHFLFSVKPIMLNNLSSFLFLQIEPLIITQKTVETQGMSWVLDNTKPKKIAKKCWLLQVCNYCDFQWLDKKVPKLDCDQEKWGKQKSTIIIMSHVLDKSVCVHKSISCCCFPEEEERIKILLWFHFFKWK